MKNLFQTRSTQTTEAEVLNPQINNDDVLVNALNEEEKILVPEEHHESVKIFFPSHPIKSFMESYLSRGLYSEGPFYEPPG